MKYYNYRLDQALELFAVSFFSLLSSMYRLQGRYNQELAYRTAVAFAGGDSFTEYIKSMEKQAKGATGLLNEAKVLRKARGKK